MPRCAAPRTIQLLLSLVHKLWRVLSYQDGDPDTTFFSEDCFHFSQRGHTSMAVALWSNMVSVARRAVWLSPVSPASGWLTPPSVSSPAGASGGETDVQPFHKRQTQHQVPLWGNGTHPARHRWPADQKMCVFKIKDRTMKRVRSFCLCVFFPLSGASVHLYESQQLPYR